MNDQETKQLIDEIYIDKVLSSRRRTPGEKMLDGPRLFATGCMMIEEIQCEAWIPTAEDGVIQKLRWKRRKDLDDIVNVLSVSGPILNWEYMTSWARKRGTLELLEQLCTEVPDLPDTEIAV